MGVAQSTNFRTSGELQYSLRFMISTISGACDGGCRGSGRPAPSLSVRPPVAAQAGRPLDEAREPGQPSRNQARYIAYLVDGAPEVALSLSMRRATRSPRRRL